MKIGRGGDRPVVKRPRSGVPKQSGMSGANASPIGRSHQSTVGPTLMKMTEGPKNIRILIADDHAIFRDGLRKLLESEPGMDVVGEAVNGDDVVKFASQLTPDIIL